MSTIITLLTDFGLRDSYVAEVKAVLASQAHPAVIIDVTHDIAPGDLRGAQYVLGRVWRRFPRGSVHLVVVDPGVGTARRALAAETAGQFFVAPDNGLLSSLPDDTRYVELVVPATAAATFHARDVFAPAAAQLANGTALSHLGRPIKDPVRAPFPPIPRRTDGDGASIVGEVIYIDRFGTLITNIPGAGLAPEARIEVNGRDVGTLRRTFSDVERGAPIAVVGSGGMLEIALRDGDAAQVLQGTIGTAVRVGGARPTRRG